MMATFSLWRFARANFTFGLSFCPLKYVSARSVGSFLRFALGPCGATYLVVICLPCRVAAALECCQWQALDLFLILNISQFVVHKAWRLVEACLAFWQPRSSRYFC